MSALYAVVSPAPYLIGCVLGAALVAAAIVDLRRNPGRRTRPICAVIGAALVADVFCYLAAEAADRTFSARTSLPLALCNAVVLVAAGACFTRVRTLVEMTYFVGLAGTLQAVVTPDLSSPFPHPVFFEYLVGHLGIVAAALVLTVGAKIAPRRGAWARTYVLVAGYTALVGAVDAVTGADYMFLRRPPANATLLSVLGPFPWYIVSAAVVALVLFRLLELPFAQRADGVAVTSWAWFVTLVLGVVVWPAMLVTPRAWRWSLLRHAGRLLARLVGIELRVHGAAVPGEPTLYLANHASYVDGLVFVLALERPATIVVGGQIGEQRIAGPFLRALGAEFVGPMTGVPVRAQLERIAAHLRAGRDVAGFPEGRLGTGDGLGRLRLGLFLVAARTGCCVVPVGIEGAGSVVPPGTREVRRGTVEVRLGAAGRALGSDVAAARELARRVAGELGVLALETAAAPQGSDRSLG